ncbi:hypothetical protein [Pantoea sp. NGS-ED-1003]|nr:hypothetical protein [Pantoea sp. NGS-ED-1003]
MNDENAAKRNRVNLTIPFSLLEKIDAHVEKNWKTANPVIQLTDQRS